MVAVADQQRVSQTITGDTAMDNASDTLQVRPVAAGSSLASLVVDAAALSDQNPTGDAALRDVLDVLHDVIATACNNADGDPDVPLHSMGVSNYAEGLRTLARYGYVLLVIDRGRYVAGRAVAVKR